MTPEDILGALVTHSAQLDFGKPDPLIMAARDEKIGKVRPQNWRLLVRDADGTSRVELWPRTTSALGSQTRTASSHSIAEIAADALIGLHERNWHALQCSIGIGEAVRPALTARLERIAYRMKNGERVWRNKIRRRRCVCGRTASTDYVPDLVELAICHLEQPWTFRYERTRAEWFGLTESHWHAVARRPFDQVAAHIWSWYFAGIGHIQHRIIQRRQRLE